MTKGNPLNLEKKIIIEPLDAYMHGVKFTPKQQEVVFKIVGDTEKEIKQRIQEAVQGLLADIDNLPAETIFGEVARTKDNIAIAPFAYVKKESVIKLVKKYFPEEVRE